MAAIVVQSKTLDISVMNSEMSDTVFKINNPQNNVTLQQIRTAYSLVLGQWNDQGADGDIDEPGDPDKSLLFDRNGVPFTFVTKATSVTTMTTYTPIE